MKSIVQLGRAPGKVNLHLNVFEKRPDGLHSLISIFQKINLADELMIRVSYDDPSIKEPQTKIRGLEEAGLKEPDTMAKAVDFWCRRFGIPVRADIFVNKRVPLASGLGGGSSDAAWVLLVLNTYFGKKTDQDYLSSCAMEVGSDVPFFLSGCPAAVVEGIGEIITPIPKPKNFFGFLLFPKEKVFTQDAYRKLDEMGLCTRVYGRADLMKMYAGPISGWRFANDFARIIRPPAIRPEKGSFYTLTGSGGAGILLNCIYPPFKADFDGRTQAVLLLS